MSRDLQTALGWVVLGAIAGWVYFIALLGFWHIYLMQLRQARPKDRPMVHVVNVFFRPPVYLAAIGAYAAYAMLSGEISGWFGLGLLLPALPVLLYRVSKGER